MVKDGLDRKQLSRLVQQHEQYDHFPFVSGDVIEKHRASLGAQLKNDLQNYLSYSRQKSPSSRTQVGPIPKTHQTARSTVNANTLLNARAGKAHMGPLKPLFDSDYVRPAENRRVLQDNSTRKNAVFKEALARYEASLKNEKDHDSQFFHQYHERLGR